VGLFRNLDFNANYTYTFAQDDQTGLVLLRRPRHQLTAEVRYGISDRAHFSLLGRYVGTREDIEAVTATRIAMPEFVVFYLTAGYQVTNRVRMFGRVDNLLNEIYQEISGFGTPERSFFVGLSQDLWVVDFWLILNKLRLYFFISVLLHGMVFGALFVGLPPVPVQVRVAVFPVVGRWDGAGHELKKTGGLRKVISRTRKAAALAAGRSQSSELESGAANISGDASGGGIEARLQPEYPPISRAMGEEGEVLVEVRLSGEGEVLGAAVMRSSGYSRLDAAALKAVQNGTFLFRDRGVHGADSTIFRKFNIVFCLNS
jgi:TonB family protein